VDIAYKVIEKKVIHALREVGWLNGAALRPETE
jgi:hypothetical protein